jgi:PTH1 family peptidyl-tRNA hydrolase
VISIKVIVGLGNPGKEYNLTRHNVGFYILDKYLGDVKWKEFNNALIYETNISGEKVLFVKPTTYMNNSGEAIKYILKYYKLYIDDLMVIQDDIALSLGKYRIKYESSDGGHNGIKSIINNLGTNKFLRLKIGLAKEKEIDTISYVLGKLTKKELNQIDLDSPRYFDIINKFINEGLDKVLNM